MTGNGIDQTVKNGLSDMQHSFRKCRNTYHLAMSIITAIYIFWQACTGFALVELIVRLLLTAAFQESTK